jgi:hypothetical protein
VLEVGEAEVGMLVARLATIKAFGPADRNLVCHT